MAKYVIIKIDSYLILNKFMIKKCLFLFCFCILSYMPLFARSASSDAIAIRVIANPKHYSALTWYKKQGFKGSPQSLMVDGYNAIRDGRTVYVNAANIPTNANLFLYTNIYLISFNQSAESATSDIFGKILEHWKFNSNQIVAGICKESKLSCLSDTDCVGVDYCESMKAKAKRDVRRLEDLSSMYETLETFFEKKGYYPKLQAGSYVPQNSLSVWPSWQDALAKEIGVKLPEDPINKLTKCIENDEIKNAKYDPKTCWDEKNKVFADADAADKGLNWPLLSRAYLYSGNALGNSYKLCANSENSYQNAAELHFCASGSINYPPTITANCPLVGTKNVGYACSITASDLDLDDFRMEAVGMPANIIKITSGNKITGLSGKPSVIGDFPITISATETRAGGATTNYSFTLKIYDSANPPPVITLPSSFVNGVYQNSVGSVVDFTITATDADGIQSFTSSGATLPAGLNVSSSPATGTYRINGTVSTTFQVPSVVNLAFTLTAKDNANRSSNITFTLKLVNTAPVINSVTN